MLKLKSSQATYPTSNAKSLACDTANEHALTCTREDMQLQSDSCPMIYFIYVKR